MIPVSHLFDKNREKLANLPKLEVPESSFCNTDENFTPLTRKIIEDADELIQISEIKEKMMDECKINDFAFNESQLSSYVLDSQLQSQDFYHTPSKKSGPKGILAYADIKMPKITKVSKIFLNC